MSEENCAACPSGLEYATEDQLLGVILSHHTLLAAKDAEIAELRKERDAARARAEDLWRACASHYEEDSEGETLNVVKVKVRRALEEGKA